MKNIKNYKKLVFFLINKNLKKIFFILMLVVHPLTFSLFEKCIKILSNKKLKNIF